MSLKTIIMAIVLIALVLMTAVNSPKESYAYAKAMGKNFKVLTIWCKDMGNELLKQAIQWSHQKGVENQKQAAGAGR